MISAVVELKTFFRFACLVLTVGLLAQGYENFKFHESVALRSLYHGERHYKVRQMASSEVLCKDEQGDLCVCGRCSEPLPFFDLN